MNLKNESIRAMRGEIARRVPRGRGNGGGGGRRVVRLRRLEFRKGLLRFAVSLGLASANFAHFAKWSQSEWRHFREGLSRFAAIGGMVVASQSRGRRDSMHTH